MTQVQSALQKQHFDTCPRALSHGNTSAGCSFVYLLTIPQDKTTLALMALTFSPCPCNGRKISLGETPLRNPCAPSSCQTRLSRSYLCFSTNYFFLLSRMRPPRGACPNKKTPSHFTAGDRTLVDRVGFRPKRVRIQLLVDRSPLGDPPECYSGKP